MNTKLNGMGIAIALFLVGCAGMSPSVSPVAKTAKGSEPLCVSMGDAGCAGISGPAGMPGTIGPKGPAGAAMPAIIASPPVVRPGATTNLLATLGDATGTTFRYAWNAAGGTLGPTGVNPTTWTAPNAVGNYLVGVEMEDDAGVKRKGYANVVVSVSPTGPIVTGVVPTESKAGSVVRIRGIGFGADQDGNKLTIGGVDASQVLSWSDMEIKAVVPAGATTGPLRATVAGVESSQSHLVILWDKENPQNVMISSGTSEHIAHQITSDGADGAILVWQDQHDVLKTGKDISAQRINSIGEVQWASSGVAVSSAPNDQTAPQVVSDGKSGAIVVWQDARGGVKYDVYAQKLNPAGEAQWEAKGVAISLAANDQIVPQIISDEAGGAIIAWQDFRTGTAHIYAQRINGAGKKLWLEGGVAISVAPQGQTAPRMISDGSGGAVVVWQDFRSGKQNDIYTQRVNADGRVQWTEDGVAISTAASDQITPALVSDGTGGATIVWEDAREGKVHVYAQRINGAGAVEWAKDGVAVSGGAGSQGAPQVVSDDLGGAILAWHDTRGENRDIYAQRVNRVGATQWTPNGIPISTAAGDQVSPHLIADGRGGALIVWDDSRGGSESDIYAQRINNAGTGQWITNGVAVSTAGSNQRAARLMSDGAEGAIIAWQDARAGKPNIFVQKVSANGLQ